MVATGGYGRAELSPGSDIDLLLVSGSPEVAADALRALLYPLWDAGLQVGHAAVTPAEAIERTQRDFHAATALLTARFIAGNPDLWRDLADRRKRWIQQNSRSLTRQIVSSVGERRNHALRAGWALAPDLKEHTGGLRDVHAALWLRVVAGDDARNDAMEAASDVLLAARDALHAEMRRKVDKLRIDLQAAVAGRLGFTGGEAADELMSEVHGAARVIERESTVLINGLEEAVTGGPRRSGMAVTPFAGIWIRDGFVDVERSVEPAPALGVRVATLTASSGRPLRRGVYAWLERCFAGLSAVEWDDELRASFIGLLDSANAMRGLEILDGAGAWSALLPEMNQIRCRAQHDPYHHFTVDAHSFAAVEEARAAMDDVAIAPFLDRDDRAILLLGTLLHDIGKGSGIDHSVAGEGLARGACTRMGWPADVVEDVCALVRWHLLLPDTATRRDLEDGGVVEETARTISSARRARLLYALAMADGRATGPAAWTSWKASLVLELYRKVVIALETGEIPVRRSVAERAHEVEAYEPGLAGRAEKILASLPASYGATTSLPEMADEIHLLLAAPAPGQVRARIEAGLEQGQSVVTVCVVDRPGALAKTAGVLALRGLSVLSARAYSTTTGLGLQRFVVRDGPAGTTQELVDDLEAAYGGRLAVDARIAEKIRHYATESPLPADVRILQDQSPHSTIIEVRARDALGLLFVVTAALADLDLDIHLAKIDTRTDRVVDVFYVRGPDGSKLDDRQALEATRSIHNRLGRFFP